MNLRDIVGCIRFRIANCIYLARDLNLLYALDLFITKYSILYEKLHVDRVAMLEACMSHHTRYVRCKELKTYFAQLVNEHNRFRKRLNRL